MKGGVSVRGVRDWMKGGVRGDSSLRGSSSNKDAEVSGVCSSVLKIVSRWA